MQSIEQFEQEADRIGYPVLIKAILGGGGKVIQSHIFIPHSDELLCALQGMRIVENKAQLKEALNLAQREGGREKYDIEVDC